MATLPPTVTPALACRGGLRIPGSGWNCSEPTNVFSITNDSWLELYNPQNQAFNLYAAHATIDSGPGTSPFYLPLGSSISPHGYLVLFPSTFSGLHMTAIVRLLIEGIPIDQVSIPTLHVDQSFARIPNGSNSWLITVSPTIDSSNSILLQSPLTTPTASLPNQSVTESGNSLPTPVVVNATKVAWNSLQFPTPSSMKTKSSIPTIANA